MQIYTYVSLTSLLEQAIILTKKTMNREIVFAFMDVFTGLRIVFYEILSLFLNIVFQITKEDFYFSASYTNFS